MFDFAGCERNQVSPDLHVYLMDESLPSLRVALRRAKRLGLGDDFWQKVIQFINIRGEDE